MDIAINGIEALKMNDAKKYDVIFMDMQMPEMGGLEATERIRASAGERSEITIVAMTANVLTGDREACMKAGMNDYIPKPISEKMVRETLNKWLSG